MSAKLDTLVTMAETALSNVYFADSDEIIDALEHLKTWLDELRDLAYETQADEERD